MAVVRAINNAFFLRLVRKDGQCQQQREEGDGHGSAARAGRLFDNKWRFDNWIAQRTCKGRCGECGKGHKCHN